jgi:flavin-binding protein dodecin
MLTTRVVEVVAESPAGFEEAIRSGMAQARARLGRVHGAWVRRQQVVVSGGVPAYQVALQIACEPGGPEG